jgi:surface antigen
MTLTSTLAIITLLWAGTALANPPGTLAETEQRAMSDTFQYALENNPTNQAADWVNPDTEHTGAVVPVRTYTDSQGQACREFITTIRVGGKQQQGYGTACRQPDGTWQIVGNQPVAQATPVASRPVYVYRPAERYYVYPHAYANPYRIYFSFSYLWHGGRLHVGNYYPSASVWHHRYYRHPHKARYHAPLPHQRWYRREHIRRSWYRRPGHSWVMPDRKQGQRGMHPNQNRNHRRSQYR